MTTSSERPDALGLDSSDRERMTWLLEFLRRDVESLRTGELLDTYEDVMSFMGGVADVEISLARIVKDGERKIRERLAGLQQRIQNGLDVLEMLQGKPGRQPRSTSEHWYWDPFSDTSDAPKRVTVVYRNGKVGFTYAGAGDAIVLAKAQELITRYFLKLRRCEHEDCRAWFLPRDGRQRYHDPACSQQRRWKEFEPKRERDYAAEYERRIKRKLGAKVKVQRRARRKGGKK